MITQLHLLLPHLQLILHPQVLLAMLRYLLQVQPMAEVICRYLQSVLPVAGLSDYQQDFDRIITGTELTCV